MRLLLLILILSVSALAQPLSIKEAEKEVNDLLTVHQKLGKKNFESKWPDGAAKEKYVVSKDGKVSYTKFYPAGNVCVVYQRTPGGTVSYERWHGNGRDAVLLKSDGRIIDYISYWPSGLKKAKYQRNKHTKESFLISNDENGRQVFP